MGEIFCAQKSAGGVLLPKSAVKFERYLMGEVKKIHLYILSVLFSSVAYDYILNGFFTPFQVVSVGAEASEVPAGKKVHS